MFEIDKDRLERLRTNLPLLRNIAGYSAKDLAEVLGTTRQTINNIEKSGGKMSITQYIAIDAIFSKLRCDNNLLNRVLCIMVDNVEHSEQEERFINDIYATIGKFGTNKGTHNLSKHLREQYAEES